MNYKNNNIVVLFFHHCCDDVTLHNFNLLKKYNPDKTIFPVGFSWHNLMKNSHVVHRHEEFPNNYFLNEILHTHFGYKKGSTSSESDLCLYDFFLHYQDFDSYFVIEWDTYCNCSLEEYYGNAFTTMDTFSAYTFTNILDLPDAIEKQYVKEWSWYQFFFSKMRTLEQENILMPYLGGTYPTSLLYYKRHVLYDMVNLILNNPNLYNNIQNEMRLGTLIQQAGYKLKRFGGETNQFFEQSHYKDYISKNIKGYYHPIKTIL